MQPSKPAADDSCPNLVPLWILPVVNFYPYKRLKLCGPYHLFHGSVNEPWVIFLFLGSQLEKRVENESVDIVIDLRESGVYLLLLSLMGCKEGFLWTPHGHEANFKSLISPLYRRNSLIATCQTPSDLTYRKPLPLSDWGLGTRWGKCMDTSTRKASWAGDPGPK